MPTAVGTETDLIHLLRNLAQLDHDAVAAYTAAAEGLGDPALRRQLLAFRDDHLRHTEELGGLLRALGETPPAGPDSQVLLTVGQVMMNAPFGDRGLLRAMMLNEDDTNAAYTRAARLKGVDPAIRDVLERGLADERRHADWVGRVLWGETRFA